MVANNEHFTNNYINLTAAPPPLPPPNTNNMHWNKLDPRHYIKLGVSVLKELKIYIKVESVKNIHMR